MKRNGEVQAIGIVHRTETGFTLIEVLLVMGVIAAISAAVLPNLGLTPNSQMSIALRDVTNNMRATYDSAVLTGRVHRMVLSLKKGEYWAEAAPLGYEGRPPLAIPDTSSASSSFNADARARLVEELTKVTAEPRRPNNAKVGEEKYYNARSILVVQKKALEPVKWSEIDDAVLFKRLLPGDVVFAGIVTDTMKEKITYPGSSEAEFAYIYFFPQGEVQQSAIQIALKKTETEINEEGPRFTLLGDPLSGHTEIREGLQEPEFTKETR